MSELISSGSMREFSTGAHRDSANDKGRCDLIPYDVIALIEDWCANADDEANARVHKGVMWNLYDFMETINNRGTEAEFNKSAAIDKLIATFLSFCEETQKSRYDLYLDVSYLYRDGAEKYGENNWKKGMPNWVYTDSASRHYFKFKRGDTDENHSRAFVWNIFCLAWTVRNDRGLVEEKSTVVIPKSTGAGNSATNNVTEDSKPKFVNNNNSEVNEGVRRGITIPRNDASNNNVEPISDFDD